jgi:hypothetical protein
MRGARETSSSRWTRCDRAVAMLHGERRGRGRARADEMRRAAPPGRFEDRCPCRVDTTTPDRSTRRMSANCGNQPCGRSSGALVRLSMRAFAGELGRAEAVLREGWTPSARWRARRSVNARRCLGEVLACRGSRRGRGGARRSTRDRHADDWVTVSQVDVGRALRAGRGEDERHANWPSARSTSSTRTST